MLNHYRIKINQALRWLLKKIDSHYGLSKISKPLFHCSEEFILREGKRIRPLLFLLSYKGYAPPGAAGNNQVFLCAASLELLHDFLLIHDDVIDQTRLRRGKPTLHEMFNRKFSLPGKEKIGPSLAIVAGDIIFALAIETFLCIHEDKGRKERALKKFLETAAYTGAGEFFDVITGYRRLEEIREKDVFLNYTLKTAKYTFEGPLLIGGLLAGVAKSEYAKLSSLGLYAGQAFQIYDDLLGIFATQKATGKPALTDLAEGKKTLFVFYAFQRLKGKEKTEFRRLFNKTGHDRRDLRRFQELILKSGAYDASLKKMFSLLAKANTLCSNLKMEVSHRQALQGLIRKLSDDKMPLELTAKSM